MNYLELETKKEKLNKKRPLTQGELKRLNEQFAIEYTYNSNAIEGNRLTLRETELVLCGFTIDKVPLKDHLEAINHKEAFNYICDLVKSKKEISESFIKEVHAIVLSNEPQDRGVYRRIPVEIVGAAHKTVQPYLIQSKMEELLDNYKNSQQNLIEQISKFHLDFEAIHPFVDGNGRTGRLLINFDLMKHGYPPIDIKYSDVKKYYEAFDEYHLNNNEKAMINLVGNYVNQRLDEYIKILDSKDQGMEI